MYVNNSSSVDRCSLLEIRKRAAMHYSVDYRRRQDHVSAMHGLRTYGQTDKSLVIMRTAPPSSIDFRTRLALWRTADWTSSYRPLYSTLRINRQRDKFVNNVRHFRRTTLARNCSYNSINDQYPLLYYSSQPAATKIKSTNRDNEKWVDGEIEVTWLRTVEMIGSCREWVT